MMTTQRETLKILCKSIVSKLENQKAISFTPRLRQVVQDEVFNLIGPFVKTEEDLKEQALMKMGARAEMLQDTDFTESDQFKAAKAVVRKTYGDDVLNGFYFQRPLKTVAGMIVDYFMRSSNIEDVFEEDAVLEKKIVDSVKGFDAKNIH